MSSVEIERRGPSFDSFGSFDSSDSLDLYRKDTWETPLLTREEEIKLGKAIRQGQLAARYLCRAERFDQERVSRLEKRVQEGKEAQNELVQSNTRLVISVAKRFSGRLPFSDLVQEGNLGLIKAAEKFDCRKGFRFSTYAFHWICQAITRGIHDKSRLIRWPVHFTETVSKVNKAKNQFPGQEPTVDELAALTGKTPSQITDVLMLSRDVSSLDVPVKTEEGEASVGEFIKDETDFFGAIDRDELGERLDEVLAALPADEERVLRQRFGLTNSGEVHTLEEVGIKFGLTRERIRQIEAQALCRLRCSSRVRKLIDFK